MAARDQAWRDVLSGSPVIRTIELWIRLGRNPKLCVGARLKAVERELTLMGYRRVPLHPLQTCADRFVWVRERWATDLEWPDLTNDPILAAVTQRYVLTEASNARP